MSEPSQGGWVYRLDDADRQRFFALMFEFAGQHKKISETGEMVQFEQSMVSGDDPETAIRYFRSIAAHQRTIAELHDRSLAITNEIASLLVAAFGEPSS